MTWNPYLQAFAALLFVLGAALALLFILRYLRSKSFKWSERELSCCELLALDNHTKLCVVRMKQKKYLLLLSARGNLVVDIINEV